MVTVKKYRDRYKMTFHNSLRLKGFEEADLRPRIESGDKTYLYDDKMEIQAPECVYVDDLTGIEYYDYTYEDRRVDKVENKSKLANNLCRSKSTIYELAVCNDWDFFCTFTIDKEKYDRYNLQAFYKDFTQKIRDLNKKYSTKINYLLVPEKHKDGAWHLHGFISGLPERELREFNKNEYLPLYIIDKIINNNPVYSWITYEKKFGFCDLEPVKDIYKASAYITKYVSKSLCETITELNAHTYYASKGLKRAEEITLGFLDNALDEPLEYDFQNDYVKVKWMDREEFEIVKDFIDKY